MKFLRQTLAVLLAVLMLAVPVTATESENWLIPKMREDPEFTDTAGTICQEAARICCEAGLMTGVDAKHFMPESGLEMRWRCFGRTAISLTAICFPEWPGRWMRAQHYLLPCGLVVVSRSMFPVWWR